MPENDAAIEVTDVTRDFGDVHALRGVSLTVNKGTVLGLLGPNGAGKTTMVRILTTLLPPSGGQARVLGLDVVRDATELRGRIALAGQFAAVDELLTGRENLIMFGELYRLGRRAAAERADELLERFSLVEAQGRIVKTYSGGMRRRLDLAAALISKPEVIFLDEPTTGLDPRGRLDMWEVIRELTSGGTTLLLTTQYLEEADKLAETIAVIDGGRVIAEGTASALKSKVGGDVLELQVTDRSRLGDAAAALQGAGFSGEPTLEADQGKLRLPVEGGGGVLAKVVRALDSASIGVDELALHRPTLDDVFLALTGHAAEDQVVEKKGRGRKSKQPEEAAS